MFKNLFRFALSGQENGTAVNASGLQQRLDSGEALTVIDVRTPHEFAAGAIPGARLIPLSTIQNRHQEIPRDQPVVVACRSGSRSRVAIEQLKRLGFDNLINLDGGLLSWQRARLPVNR